MNEQRFSALVRKTYIKQRKRIIAFMLSVAMILTNVGSNLSIAFAAEDNTITAVFLLEGRDIQEAVNEAVEGGEVFDPSELEITAKSASLVKSYKKLLGGDGNRVYEIFPTIEGEDIPDGAAIRLFINADTNEVIFLFVNESDETIAYRANIDGYQTGKVTVNPHSSNVKAEIEAPPVEQPKPETVIKPESGKGNEAGTTDPNGTVVDENKTEENTGENIAGEEENNVVDKDNGESNGEASGDEADGEDVSGGIPGEGTSNDNAGKEETPNENVSDGELSDNSTSGDVTSDNTTSGENASDDSVTDDVVTGDSSSDDGALDNSVTDEGTSDDSVTDEGASDDSVTDEGATDDSVSGDNATDEGSSDDNTSDGDVSDDSVSADEASDDNASDEGASVALSIYAVPRVATALSENDDNVMEDSDEPDEEDGSEVNAPDSVEESDKILEKEDSEEEQEEEEVADVEEEIDFDDEITLEDDVNVKSDDIEGAIEEDLIIEEEEMVLRGSISGKAYNQVELSDMSTARAYVVALDKLLAGIVEEGYMVSYSVDPLGAATIKGAENVEAGLDLTFTVKPQVGYEIVSVTANGEELEVNTASDSDAESTKKTYTVYEVEEDLEIVVTLEETISHPYFEQSVEVNGVLVTATAEEGILPEGTELTVEEVTEQVEQIVKEKAEAEQEKVITSVLAYDINLMLDGKKLDNSWSENGYVTVTFSGERIVQQSQESESLQIAQLETPTETVEAADGNTAEVAVLDELTIDNLNIKTEGREEVDVSGEASVEELQFDASHFTIYAVLGTGAWIRDSYTVNVGANLNLVGENDYYHIWSSSNNKIATVSGSGNSAAVTAVKAGTVTITHKYKGFLDLFWAQETFAVTVNNANEMFHYKYSSESSNAQLYYSAADTEKKAEN